MGTSDPALADIARCQCGEAELRVRAFGAFLSDTRQWLAHSPTTLTSAGSRIYAVL